MAVPDSVGASDANLCSTDEFSQEAVRLFNEYRQWFGLSEEDEDGDPLAKQELFESKFSELCCRLRGHDVVPDHCLKFEHDYCQDCMTRRDALSGMIRRDWRNRDSQ